LYRPNPVFGFDRNHFIVPASIVMALAPVSNVVKKSALERFLCLYPSGIDLV
jgi:hypothetical protein